MFSASDIKSVIDYLIARQPANSWPKVSIAVTVLAVLVSGVATYLSYRALQASREQLKAGWRNHIRTEWNGLMDACVKEGRLVDPAFTTSYYAQSHPEKTTYEAFCYRAWSLVDFIVAQDAKRGEERLNNAIIARIVAFIVTQDAKRGEERLNDAIIAWIVAFHRTWLERNPSMFASSAFWKKYDEARGKPLMIFQSRGMPRLPDTTEGRTDTVNWDEVSKDYQKWVLSPWAPEMMMPDPSRSNKRRNFLFDQLLSYQATSGKDLEILDFGCGPGNVLEYLRGTEITKIVGLDSSKEALKIASDRARKYGIDFQALPEDMRNFGAETDFDVIISVNSILPAELEDIRTMFRAMHSRLRDDGRVFLILPAFDACEALLKYWEDHYRATLSDDKFVGRCVDAFKKAKIMDKSTRSYADDGEHPQCFHTKESIQEDLPECGFEIIGDIQKVQYPWAYAARYDYGNFEGQPEIWDWYVEAKKKLKETGQVQENAREADPPTSHGASA